jgi:hypothetical protein
MRHWVFGRPNEVGRPKSTRTCQATVYQAALLLDNLRFVLPGTSTSILLTAVLEQKRVHGASRALNYCAPDEVDRLTLCDVIAQEEAGLETICEASIKQSVRDGVHFAAHS